MTMDLTLNSVFLIVSIALTHPVNSAPAGIAESFESVCAPNSFALASDLSPVRQAALRQLAVDTPSSELCALAEIYVPGIRRDYLHRLVQSEILARSRPQAKEVEAILDSVDTLRTEPAAAKVSDITIASESGASQTFAEMKVLRDAINDGRADFEQTARTRSVSSTRFRGGSAGFVRLQLMDPALAEFVSPELCDGTVRGPVDFGQHISLIRCTDFRQEKEVSMERARQKAVEIATRRNSRTLISKLLGHSSEMQTLTLQQLETLASKLFPAGLSVPDHTIQLAAEAEARLRTQVVARYRPPPMSYVESQYGKYKARHIFPAEFDFELLRFPVSKVDRDQILSIERRFEAMEITIAEAAEEVPESQLQRLVLDQDQAFLLGVAVEESLKTMAVGSRSDLLQDSEMAYLIVLHDRKPARQKTLAEAEQLIRQRYANAVMLRIRKQLEAELLAANQAGSGEGQGE